MQVTTSTRPNSATVQRARALAGVPGLAFVERRGLDESKPALAVHRDGLSIRVAGRNHRWHPGLLHTRIEAGWTHPLVRAMDLRPGDRVLDCSLGLGIDAMFLARLTGRPVWAVEAIAAVALLTSEGLRARGEAVRVVHAEATAFLRTRWRGRSPWTRRGWSRRGGWRAAVWSCATCRAETCSRAWVPSG